VPAIVVALGAIALPAAYRIRRVMLSITPSSMHDQLKSTTVTEAEQALMAKLLVVDDEKNIRVNLAKFLESCGHQVESAESGPQALAILAGLLPNLPAFMSRVRS